MSKIVIALGGNALEKKKHAPTAENQLKIVRKTCEFIADISCDGHEIALVHGNGPQVGRILLSSETSKNVTPSMPFDVCGAMSQGYIGYHIQQSLKYALNVRGINIPVLTVATQIVVDKNDKAFEHPSKPIGAFYSEEDAKKLSQEKGYLMKEDAGRGWRRIVASPLPKRIVEIKAIKSLSKSSIVISCGGGGIPVIENMDGTLDGVDAVIDKDFAAELLAEQVDADILMILTEVEKVAVNWGMPNQENLSHISLKEAAMHVKNGQFAPGSMLPKIEAAMKFVRAFPDKKAIITSLDKAKEALEGQTGTVISFA